MTAPSSKPATSITIDGVDFGAIVETASDSSKNSTCIWSIGHHNNTIFLDVKDPNHPGLPSARSVIVKRDSIAHKKYNITIYYLGRPVDPALLFTASSIAQFNNPYTPHQIKEILPVVLRAVERSPVCTGVFVNSPHYESLRASFHKSYHNMFSDWKTGDQRVIVCTAPITHAGVVYDATFRDLGCGRVVATKDGWMCTACKSLANTMGQRVIRQDLQRPTDGNNDLNKLAAAKEKEEILRNATLQEYLTAAHPKFIAHLDHHPLFKEWFYDLLLRVSDRGSGRQWPVNVLRFSLALSSISSMCCRLMRSIGFTFPSKSTTRKYRKKYAMEPGLDTGHIKRMVDDLHLHLPELRAKFKEQTDEELLDLLSCGILVADEVQDVPEVVVVRATLKVTGLINHGPGVHTGDRESEEVPAKHTLQLMFVSLGASMAIPIAHFDTRDMNTPEFVSMIQRAVVVLDACGLNVLCLGADGGTVNRSGFKQLGDPESWPSNLPCPILIQDVPHLLKRIRNAMINHEVLINGTTRISWHAIDDLYKQSEQNEGLRLVQHLTKDARSPDAWAKMRVPLARAVLCRKTAHALEHYCTHPDAKGTASFIRQVDTFYSIMTDARPFTKDSITEGGADTRLKQLQGVLEYFEDWKVRVDAEVAAIRANQTLTAKDRAAAIKTVKSHFIAMESFDDLKLTISNFTAATRLLLTRFPFMRVYPRSFSTNCLESYFALARALGRSSTKVTARQMKLVAVSYQLIGHLRSFMSQLKTNYDPITELNMGGVQADTQGGTAQASTAPAQTTIDAAAVVASDLVPPVSVDVESDQMPARASGTESGDEEWEALMDMVNDEEDERLIYELSKLLLADDLTDKEKVDVKEMLDKMLSDVL